MKLPATGLSRSTLVAAAPVLGLGVAIGAEDLEVLEPIVVADPIDVVELDRDRLSAPLGNSAVFAPGRLESGVVQAELQVSPRRPTAPHQELLKGDQLTTSR